MKKILLLSVLLLNVFVYACSNSENKIAIDNYYYHQDQYVAFFQLSPGHYSVKMDINNPADKALINFEVAGAADTDKLSPVKKQFKIEGIGDFNLDFIIKEEAEYKVSFSFAEFVSLSTSPYIETNDGLINKIDPIEAAYIQLDYIADDNQNQDYEWLYGEVVVPEGMDADYTTYQTLGYKNVKLGMNRYPGDNSMIIFALSERPETAAIQKILIGKGENVTINEISSNEGKELQFLSTYPYDWESDSPLCFLINQRKISENQILLSAWFSTKTDSDWKYIASWQTKPRDTKNIYSYILSHDRMFGFSARKGEFGNIWTKVPDRGWEGITKARFSVIEDKGRNDFSAGISESNPEKFYLVTGGFEEMNKPKHILEVKKTKKQPDIDLQGLNGFIDGVLETNKSYSWDYIPDSKIPVISGSASESQRGEGISNSFDNNSSTLYHSPWRGTQFPVTLTYNFDEKDTIDYIIYYPRTDGGQNGNFIEFELWTQSQTQPDYVKVGEYNFGGHGQPSVIDLPQQLADAKSIKFVVKSGVGDPGTNGFVSCSEMEFYKKDGKSSIPDIFTDITCSQLKPNLTLDYIETITNKNYRDLAKALYNKSYASDYRIRNYEPYCDPDVMVKQTGTSTYSLLDNATGIFVERDEDIAVFVGDVNGQRVLLRSINLDKDYTCTDYLLKEGMNVIRSKDKGLLYVMHHTSESDAKPIKIHIASGSVNGYYDVTKNSNADWQSLLDAAVSNYIDVLGKYAHLTFHVEDFKKYTPDINALIQVYDSITWLEQKFTGLEKYDRLNKNGLNKNRMYFYVSTSPYYMFATSYRTGYTRNAMPEICNVEKLRTSAIWGPAHEVGHINQLRPGFLWTGMTEVSNNIYSLYVQRQFGNPSRLATERLNSGFDGSWYNRYEKGFTEIIAGRVSHMKHGDVFCKLIPFWQLELYNSIVKGNKDFYADVHEQIRRNSMSETNGDAQLAFMKACCDVAEADFTDFFVKWGMLVPIEEVIIDHSSIQGQEYSRSTFSMTSQQVDDLKIYAAKYKKPEENVHYIHDTKEDCLELFKQGSKIKKGKIERNADKIDMSGWENVVVFEVYDGNHLIFVTPTHSFKLPENIAKPVIHAVPAKGKPVVNKL